MSLLVSLLSALTFACPQAPSASDYSQHTALELLPADTLAVVELSLEPWDRLRSQTRAAKVLLGQELLRTALASMPLPEGTSPDDLRKALGSAKFTLAVTRKSIVELGAVVAVEVIGLDGADFDWPAHLQRIGATSIHKIKQGWIVALPISEFGSGSKESLQTWLDHSAEPRLMEHPDWREMRSGMVTPNDLLRLSVPIWNFNAEFLSQIAAAFGSDLSLEFVERVSECLFGGAQGNACAILTATIDGENILERTRVDVGPRFLELWSSIGDSDEFLAIAAQAPSDATNIQVVGMSGSKAGIWLKDLVNAAMLPTLDETDREGEFILNVVDDIAGVMKCLGSRIVVYFRAESDHFDEASLVSVQTTGREELFAIWEETPAQMQTMLPLVMAEISAAGSKVTWEGDDLLIGLNAESWRASGQSSSERWTELLPQIKSFGMNGRVVSLGVNSKEVDGEWLTSEAVSNYLSTLGLTIPRLKWESGLNELRRPSYQMFRIDGRWLEGEARSTFGVLFAQLDGQLFDTGESMPSGNELDEPEF